MSTITSEHFESRTGYPPEQDDLERANCPDAGKPGHYYCGWHPTRDLPIFITGRDDIKENAR